MQDNRRLMHRLKQASPDEQREASHFNIQEDTFKIAVQYPKNLRLGHFIRYMCAPTFCY